MNLFMIRSLAFGSLTIALWCGAAPAWSAVAGDVPPVGGPSPAAASDPVPVAPNPGTSPATGAAPAGGTPSGSGTSLASCAVGNCQITVRAGDTIPVPASTEVSSLRVAAINLDTVRLEGRAGGPRSVLCVSYCNLTVDGGDFAIELGNYGEAYENRLHITLVSHTADTAVLRLDNAPNPSTTIANLIVSHWLPSIIKASLPS